MHDGNMLLTAWCTAAALMDGPKGFDASHAMWRASGWREVRELRRRLQELKELRELVRSLGRSGGKGPIRRAPEQVAFPIRPAYAAAVKNDLRVLPAGKFFSIDGSRLLVQQHLQPSG